MSEHDPVRQDASERPKRMSDDEYLSHIEQLAQAVFDAAVDERGAAIFDSDLQNTPLERAIHDLICAVRRVHYDGDGCLER